MKRLYLILSAACIVVSTFADKTVSTDRAYYHQGEDIVVNCHNIADSTNVYIYQDAALLPLIWYYQNQSGQTVADAQIRIPGYTEPWKHVVKAEQSSSKMVLDSAVFYVEESPVRSNDNDESGHKIWLMTDIHVMSPELVLNDGKALQDAIEADRKMLRQSADIMNALVDSVIKDHPDLLLIAGDLTKDGELLSHQLVADYLNRIQQAGIQVLVIPGNHDIKNPNATYYDGDSKRPAEHISETDFAEIYKDFGYDDAKFLQDTSSLSYVAEPIRGIRIIGIDATRCKENLSTVDGDAQNKRVDYGRLRPQTLQWILDRADEAKAEDRIVIAMMHHQMLEHFNEQSIVLASAAIEQGDSIAELFIEHGIRLLLTGHMHISNATTFYNESLTDSLVEISTGATVSYPVPYRLLSVNADRDRIEVKTRNMHCMKDIADMGVFSREELAARMGRMMSSVANMFSNEIDKALAEAKSQIGDDDMMLVLVDKLESALPKTNSERALLAYQYFGEPFTLAMLTASEGNEDRKLTNLLDPMIEEGIDSLLEYIIVKGDFEHTTFEVMGFPITISTVSIVQTFGSVIKLMIAGKDDEIEKYMSQLGDFRSMLDKMKVAIQRANKIKTSLLEDISYMDTDKENKTNDITLTLSFPAPNKLPDSIEHISSCEPADNAMYDILGRQLKEPAQGIYIQGGKKIFR